MSTSRTPGRAFLPLCGNVKRVLTARAPETKICSSGVESSRPASCTLLIAPSYASLESMLLTVLANILVSDMVRLLKAKLVGCIDYKNEQSYQDQEGHGVQRETHLKIRHML